jgi:hypothetical protein
MIYMPFRAKVLLSILTFVSHALDADPLWLSDRGPHAHGHGSRGHGGPVEVRKGVYYKRLWLREGVAPESADYVAQADETAQLVLIDTMGKVTEKSLEKDDEAGVLNVAFAMPDEGFYNAYVEQQRVAGDVLEVRIAKAEVKKHSCREGHDHVQEKMPPHHHAGMPLEIVRNRQPKENFHTRMGHGDEVSFTVLRNGDPLPGAQVTLTSGQGWSKSLRSDKQGRVKYTMIRDYYPAWEQFEKRHAQPYLVNALYTLPEAGELDGQRYRQTRYLASYTGNYYPSPDDYESYAYGLSFGLFALLSTGSGIYLFRRRRKRPYQEVSFND